MSQHIDAIYDNGVLKPLQPLTLPDQARVKIIVEAEPAMKSAAKIAMQQAALQSLWADIDKLPKHENNDAWSVRNHDELLYGGKR